MVKLPDSSILTIDPFARNSERYVPSTNTWISDSTVPVSLYDPFGFEMGAGFLYPMGKHFSRQHGTHRNLYAIWHNQPGHLGGRS